MKLGGSLLLGHSALYFSTSGTRSLIYAQSYTQGCTYRLWSGSHGSLPGTGKVEPLSDEERSPAMSRIQTHSSKRPADLKPLATVATWAILVQLATTKSFTSFLTPQWRQKIRFDPKRALAVKWTCPAEITTYMVLVVPARYPHDTCDITSGLQWIGTCTILTTTATLTQCPLSHTNGKPA